MNEKINFKCGDWVTTRGGKRGIVISTCHPNKGYPLLINIGGVKSTFCKNGMYCGDREHEMDIIEVDKN